MNGTATPVKEEAFDKVHRVMSLLSAVLNMSLGWPCDVGWKERVNRIVSDQEKIPQTEENG